MRAVTAGCYCLGKWVVHLEDFQCPQLKTVIFLALNRDVEIAKVRQGLAPRH